MMEYIKNGGEADDLSKAEDPIARVGIAFGQAVHRGREDKRKKTEYIGPWLVYCAVLVDRGFQTRNIHLPIARRVALLALAPPSWGGCYSGLVQQGIAKVGIERASR